MRKQIFSVITIVLLVFAITACGNEAAKNSPAAAESSMEKQYNPVVYFEIPVTDMDRAIAFYSAVFGFSFDKEVIDGNEMALFPFSDQNAGISGALAKGTVYKPVKEGVIVYFRSQNIDTTLHAVTGLGGKVLYPKTSNGELGFVAEFEDSEGNRIALHEPAKKAP